MKKTLLSLGILAVVVCSVSITSSAVASNPVIQKQEKQVVLPEGNGINLFGTTLPGGGGTVVSENLQLYPYSGSVFTNASTVCSKTCKIVAVINYLYKDNVVVSSQNESNNDAISAYVEGGNSTAYAGSKYKATSSHGATNYFGYSTLDSQEATYNP